MPIYRRLGGGMVVHRLLTVFRQVGAHIWPRDPAISRQQRDRDKGRSTLVAGSMTN